MNKSILTFTIFLLSIAGVHSAKAQCPITWSDLEKSCKLYPTAFETFAMNKGFSFNRYSEDQFLYKEYLCKTPGKDMRKDLISITTGFGINPIISYKTTDKQLYLDTKAELTISGGYLFIKEEQHEFTDKTKATWYYYLKGKKQIILYSYDLSGIITYVEIIQILP